jgi:hypothetical protein
MPCREAGHQHGEVDGALLDLAVEMAQRDLHGGDQTLVSGVRLTDGAGTTSRVSW